MTPDIDVPQGGHGRCFLVFALVGLGIIFLLCVITPVAKGSDWTMMVYMAADNNLGEKDHDQTDFNEMFGYSGSNVDIILLWDDYEENDTRLIVLNDTGYSYPQPAWLDDEENMGDGDTLEDFVDWSLSTYPSTDTFLNFWSHGGGCWGCCVDESGEEDYLDIGEIHDALDSGLGKTTLDIIGFSACSMASTEVCYELHGFCDYMVSSEKSAWLHDDYGFHWPYDEILDEMESSGDAEAICRTIVDKAMDSSETNNELVSHTWCVLDMAAIPDLNSDLDDLAGELLDEMPEHYMELADARLATEEYKTGERVDLYHFAENVHGDGSLPTSLRDAAQDVMDAIDDVVVYERRRTGDDVTKSGLYEHAGDIDRGKGDEAGGIDKENGDEAGDIDKEKDEDDYPVGNAHGLNIYFPVNSTERSSKYLRSDVIPHFISDNLWDEWVYEYAGFIFVDDSGSKFEDGSLKYPFRSIQDGVDAADDGDIVRVFVGGYEENVLVETSIDLVGNGTSSIIHPTSGHGVEILADWMNLSGFTIYTLTGEDDVHVDGDNVTVSDCTLTSSGDNGISFTNCRDGRIENCEIAFADSAGVYLQFIVGLTVSNCDIHDNAGDGLFIDWAWDTIVQDCTIHDNSANGSNVDDVNGVEIVDCDIYDNDAHGVFASDDALNVDARFNYWGDPTGPGGEGPGLGDEITKYVLYSPWLSSSSGTLPQTFYVDETGSIQAAVDHATPGDDIKVYQGTYVENILVDKSLDLIGLADIPPYPTIYGNNSGDAVRITTDWVRIERFNIHAGSRGDDNIHVGGGADHVTITECNLSTCGDDGIYYHYESDFCIVSFTTINNSGNNGIHFDTSPDNTASRNSVYGCSISGNQKNGILIEDRCYDNSISQTTIGNNPGNGIENRGNHTRIMNSTIEENGLHGIHVLEAEDTILMYCDIENNTDHGIFAENISSNTDARFCFWGNSSGPGGDGPGGGDEITSNVKYSPWYGYPIGTVPQVIHSDLSGILQHAIDFSKIGDTILVGDGIYFGHLTINKNVSLIGNGPKRTILNGEGKGDVVRIIKPGGGKDGMIIPQSQGVSADGSMDKPKKGPGVLLSGFTIIGSGSWERDAGIKVLADGSTIRNVECTDNQNGVLVEGGKNNILLDISCLRNTCGIHIAMAVSTVLKNVSSEENGREGIMLVKAEGTNITHSVVAKNGLGILVKDNSRNNFAHHNRILDNRDFGIRVINNSEQTFNATRNFWGRDSGPFHTRKNPKHPEGPGGNVTDLVEFSPWVDGKGSLIYSQEEMETDDGDEGFLSGFDLMFTLVILGLVHVIRRYGIWKL